jgi:sulfide:quinone oxidoreductase
MHAVAEPNRATGPIRIVIVGGGVAGLEAAFALRELGVAEAEVTLLAPTDEFVYRPMTIAEPFSAGWAHRHPLVPLAREARAELVQDALTEVDPEQRTVRTAGGLQLSYDALLLCHGAELHPRYEHVTTLNDERMDELLNGLVRDIEDGYTRSLAIVIPAPMPWPLPAYELALMSAGRAWDRQTEVGITVLTPEESPLAVFGREASLELSRLLSERKIRVITSSYCEVPKAGTVTYSPGDGSLTADRVVALPELRGRALAGLPSDGSGFIPVDTLGRVRGVESVWAAGDATDFPIKHGGVASQMADTAAQSIAAQLGVCTLPEPFEPILEGVLLTGGRSRYVRGRPTGGHGADSELIRLSEDARPSKIVARYLAPHLIAAASVAQRAENTERVH